MLDRGAQRKSVWSNISKIALRWTRTCILLGRDVNESPSWVSVLILAAPSGFFVLFYWGQIKSWKPLTKCFVVCVLRVHGVLCHVGWLYSGWNFVAGTKEVDRQEVLAGIPSQLQTSVIPRLSICVHVYLSLCVWVRVCKCVCGFFFLQSRKYDQELAGLLFFFLFVFLENFLVSLCFLELNGTFRKQTSLLIITQ